MTITVRYHRSPEIEGWLNRIISPSQWAYNESIPLSEIDVKASRKAQNRDRNRGDLDESTVLGIMESKRAGQPVPPLILRRLPNGRYLIGNGNHRNEADIRLGITHCAAYVLDVDDDVFYLISAAANAVNGREPGADFILRSAAYTVASKGMAAKHVAPLFGLTPKQLTDYLQAERGRQKIRAARLDATTIPSSKAYEIARLDQDHVAYLGAELSNGAVSAEAARRAVTAIKSKPAAQQQAEVAAQRALLQATIAEKKRPATAPRRRTDMAKALTHLSSITPELLAAAKSTANSDDAARLNAAMAAAATAIAAVLGR